MPRITPADHSWTVIANPRAGGGLRPVAWQLIQQLLRQYLPDHHLLTTRADARADQLAAQAIRGGSRHILAIGGDGTHHSAINGIMQATQGRAEGIIYALLPIGTGNDWIRSHGIPRGLRAWFDQFCGGHLHRQNIGRLHYQAAGAEREAFFANVVGLAYDGFVVRVANAQPPRRGGRLFYLWLTLRCLFDYRPQRARIDYDGQRVEDAFYTINIGIGRYSGGGMQLTPQADPAGDYLALTYARTVSRLNVVLNTYRFYNGRIGDHARITTTRARHVCIEAPAADPLPVEADGEFLGYTPISVELLPAALTFIGPAPRDGGG